jgi:uncharacterized lipoprotein YddW (UPF0748 family)
VPKASCQQANQAFLSGYCDGSLDVCCFNTTRPVINKLQSCGLSATKGKGVCVEPSKCPGGNVALSNSECSSPSTQVCCYSLQNNVNYYEFRGVWVSTVANIDWPSSRTLTTAQQQQEIINILDVVEKTGLNAIVFQVRPAGDAFYASKVEPWSYYLTGTQGKAPNPLWDPLKFVVTEAHRRQIDVHAWINPYRVRNKGETYQLHSSHMGVKFSKYTYNYNGYLWADPGRSLRNFENS